MELKLPTLCFATNNPGKLAEVAKILEKHVEIIGLKAIGCTEVLPETHDTIEANSKEKAEYVYQKYGVDCFADDSGLEVEALGWAPGVYSSSYGGMEGDSERNIDRLLKEMATQENRKARFKTVITLVRSGKINQFTGLVEGHILKEKTGTGGFGYDPIFVPEGESLSFAEMGIEKKNAMSHRAKAVKALVHFLMNT